MAGNNTTKIDDLVDPVAVDQFIKLQGAGKELRMELVALLETAIKLNSTLGGSTPATFQKNLKASTEATEKIIANNNKQIENEAKKAAKQEEIYNKYLINLSKQEAARQQADAKEIAAAEKKAAKLQAIADAAAAKRKSQIGPTIIGGEGENAYQPNATGTAFSSDAATAQAANIEAITAAQIESAAGAEEATAAVQAETVAYTELQLAIRSNIEQQLELQAELAGVRAEMKGLSADNAASAARMVTLKSQELELNAALAQNKSMLNQQSKELINQEGSAAQLSASLANLRLQYDQLSTAERENEAIGGVMLAEIKMLDAQVKELALSTGNTSKQIGDYAKALDVMGTAGAFAEKVQSRMISSLVRMAAHFIIVSLIFEAVSKLYEWIKSLDMFTGRLDKNLQSWEAWTNIMKEADKAAGDGIAKLEVLNKAAQDNNLTEKDRIAAAEKMKELWPDKLKNLSDEAIMNGEVKKSIDEVTASIEKQALAEAGLKKLTEIASQELEIRTQKDKLNYAKAAELRKAAIASQQETVASELTGNSETAKRIAGGVTKAIIKSRTDRQQADLDAQLAVLENTKKVIMDNIGDADLAKAAEGKPSKPKKANDSANTDLLEYQRLQLEEAKKLAKAIIDNDQLTSQTRLAAIAVYAKRSNDLIDNAEKIALADKNLREQQRTNIVLKFENERKDIAIEMAKQREDIDKQEIEKHKRAIQELISLNKGLEHDSMEDLSQGAIIAAQALTNAKDKAINAKNVQFAQGKISEKKYNKDILAINDEFNIQRIAQELTTQQTILAIQEGTRDSATAQAKANGATVEELANVAKQFTPQITSTNNKIADLINQLGNAKNKQRSDNLKGNKQDKDDDLKKKQEELVAIFETASEINKDINDVIDANFEKQIAHLDKIGEKIQENAQIEKDAVNNSLDTQENKARALAVIDAQAASAQKANAQQIADIKTKQARADKAAAISEIILNTAIGVSKVLGQTGIFGLAAWIPVAALGALQLAKVVATPIPQYAKGTSSHKGGYAIVGDGGGPERIIEPGKAAYYSPGVATLVDLPRGTVVEPYKMLPHTPNWQSTRSDNREVVEAIDRLGRKEQPRSNPRLTGWVEAQRQADAWGKYSSNFFK